jgi:hypothetical protein
MLKEAHALLEQLDCWMGSLSSEDLDLVEAERQVQERLNEVGRLAMKRLFRLADTQAPEVEFEGARWGARREVPQEYFSIFGTVRVERSTYQRPGGGRTLIPMDVRLGIVEKRYTPRVGRLMTLGIALMTAEECERYLQEAGVAQVSKSTLSRIPRDMVARHEQRRDELNAALREAEAVPEGATVVQVGLDGVMVPQDGEYAKPRGRKSTSPAPARHERRYGTPTSRAPCDDNASLGRAWHEASVGTISFWDADGNHLKTVYIGRMPESGMTTLHTELKRELDQVLAERPDIEVQFASDGDAGQWLYLEALRKEVAERGHATSMILDFFHAAEYLHRAAAAVDGKDTPEARVRASGWKELLKEFEDGGMRVLKAMRHQRTRLKGNAKEELDTCINYIAKHYNHGRMNYAQATAKGLPRGTGTTEAAAKTLVGTRMKRAGARFSQHGGQTILTLRSVEKSGRFSRFSAALEDTYRANVRLAA